ncbi:MAG: phage holin family protein [Actinobacteria bacterium]|nr:phage holin family protein [Actinomycetota bacterium]
MDLGEKTDRIDSDSNHKVGALIKDITTDVSTLVRKEIELAKAEVSQIVREKLVAVGLFVVGGVVAVLILPFALLTLMEVLAIWLQRWAAALIVTLMMIAGGGLLFVIGAKKIKGKTLPEETIESIKEDLAWAKNRKP